MKHLNSLLQKRLEEMCLTGHLFRSSITGEQIWEAYLNSFNPDPVFRDPSSSVHNCKLCNNFIRRYGNIIAFDDQLNLMTMWDVVGVDPEYAQAVKDIQALLKTGKVENIFIETFDWLNASNFEKTKKSQTWFLLGLAQNTKVYNEEEALKYPGSGIKAGDIKTFNHFAVSLPDEFVDKSGRSREALMSEPRQRAQVFKRGLEEITLDTLELVKDLEAQGSLLNGESYKHIVQKAIEAKKAYDALPEDKKDAFLWVKSAELGVASGFRNIAIGTLMVDLSEGKDLNQSVEAFNKMMDPINYKKCTAPITKKQIKDAEEFVEKNGYSDSFSRRCATIEDIMTSDILHANMNSAAPKVSVFASISASKTPSALKFDGIQEVGIEKFMEDILPSATSVELYLSAKHKRNFVNLLTLRE